jgi:hypothetical protein
MIRVRLLKRKKKEVKVYLGLVANGMFQAWWPMEGSMLGDQWKVPCLVTNGRFHAYDQWKVPCLVANGM